VQLYKGLIAIGRGGGLGVKDIEKVDFQVLFLL